MYTLAFELSASPCSLALLDGNRILASQSWPAGRTGDHRLFTCMAALFKDARLAPERIGQFAVGLGPGAYAGLRMALATARTMALPGKRPVFGIASAELIAREVSERHGVASIAVIGDARRQKLWLAHYDITARGPALLRNDIILVSPAELPALVKNAEALATPHSASIGSVVKAALPAGNAQFIDNILPTAAMAGRWAPAGGQQDGSELTGTPLTPIYLHKQL